jgi:3-oxoacyl-[acyl-carrier protein] reductase
MEQYCSSMGEQMPDYTSQGTTTGRIALVTGAAGSLGKATVKMLLGLGLKVVMVDISRDGLKALASEFGSETWPLAMNLGDPDNIETQFAVIPEDFRDIDILVNNAGILSNNKAEATTVNEWERVIDINLNGVFFLSRLVIPGMKKRGWGRIINTASLAAKTGGITAGTAYSTSKGAVISLTFSLAAELAPFGVTANGIAPAYVRTPMVTEQLTEEQRQELLKKIPVGRFCEPEEFAHVVRFLIDDLAGFITGEIIDQNGGLHFD